MSDRGKIVLLFSIVTLFGVHAVKWKYGHFWVRDVSLLSFLHDLFLILGSITSLLAVLFCVKKIRKRKHKGYWLPIISFTMFLCLYVFFSVQINKRDSSPEVLNAFYDGDLNGIRLILKSNKTYSIQDYSVFGGNEYYGNYFMKNDTIVFETEFPLGKDRDLIGQKMLIRDNKVLIDKDSLGNFINRFGLTIQ